MRRDSEAEREYVRDLERIRREESGDLDELGRDPGFHSSLRTFLFCVLATGICLLAYFGFVASH